ncbi:MAG: hypothetical protein HQK76_19725 [Desulfobacterales bacterium]|nr:hypothetical protein [Desulfobacterales bacterium]
MKKIITAIFGVMLFCGTIFAGTAEVAPEGAHLLTFLYSPFPYSHAWDNDRNKHQIGYDMINMANSLFGAEVIDGSYEADYWFYTLGYIWGITPRLTFNAKLPYFHSVVNQKVNISAPNEQMTSMIQGALESMDVRTEKLNGDGWGDLDVWLLYQYLNHEKWKISAGIGYRSQITATSFGKNTEKLNVGTQEQDDILFNHNIDFKPFSFLGFNYELEFNEPLQGSKHTFVPNIGGKTVSYKPGWQITHEFELKSYWWNDRVTLGYGYWYRNEGKATTGGVQEEYDHDYAWDKIVISYSGINDYRKKILPFPFLIDFTYWHLIKARNTRAYFGSYWEIQLTMPIYMAKDK